MTRRRSSKSTAPETTSETELDESPEVTAEATPEVTPAESISAPPKALDKDPVELTLHTPTESGIKEKASKESIEASIKEKLSRKTDSDDIDPFVPSSQLEKEVKDIASKGGFPLSRGTEVGARLMARAKRTSK